MGLVKTAVGDAVLTSLWVAGASTLGTLTLVVSSAIGVSPRSPPGLAVTTLLATALLLIFSILGALLGGASFNPATTVALKTAGLKPDATLLALGVRFPAQAAGGVAGALTILQLMPSKYKHMLKGPSLKVDSHTGALAEGAFTFVLCLALLTIFTRGPRNLLVKMSMVAIVTVALVVTGSSYTGPSMNPANAFGWAYVNGWHTTWELFYVYWMCPFVGAFLAATIFKLLFPVQKPKEKKA
ncbi:hypothetical protein MLD38_030512 [Melastoma candidum]|uniref:Uncharacterized protein n=1 Tax=Melastoma candidum TaxID=119954 RepID=A0ACB9MS30_9MYRT|nr:hypothetical protein MLD38_030512 [Melastoma candidum]